MTAAEAGGKPCHRCARQKRGRRHERQNHGVGARASDGAAGLRNHLGHPTLGIRLGQPGSRHDYANEVCPVLGGHVRMPEAGGDDPRSLRTDIRLDRLASAPVGAKQPVQFECEQWLGCRSGRREGIAGRLRGRGAHRTPRQRGSNDDRQPPHENAMDAVTEFDLFGSGGVPGRPQPAGKISPEGKARDRGKQKPESRQ
jgi:hypothetical protein